MPPGERRRRPSAFGELLGPLQPLPDDEEQAPAARPELVPDPPADTTPAPEPEPEPEEEPAPAAKTRTDRRAPVTIRLNERARALFWDAYLEAKRTEDPLLTLQEFASMVVEDGVARRARRRKP